MPIPISLATIDRLKSTGVVLPLFDPAAVSTAVLHIGPGGFHRAHMARYTNELMNIDPSALAWGIVGAGLRPADAKLRSALRSQDGLYSLTERGQSGETVTLIGSLRDVVHVATDRAALANALAAARIVSLTVTENGYCLDPASKRLDLDHPDIAADLRAPDRPCTAIGLIADGYRRRMDAGAPAFTALSCDNIQHNGRVLAAAVTDYAARVDPALAEWIQVHARFPNTMVDRITPVPLPADIETLAERYGVADAVPVVCEPFSQWVIEDDFADGRPAWERVGARFVPDVAPYERMKLRLLNASHLAVASLARLVGHSFVDEAMRDVRLRRYMTALMNRETGPTLGAIPGIDLEAYKVTLIERFANPAIKDTVERVNTDAPLNYLLDPIRDRLAAGAAIDLLALAVAAWLRRAAGFDERGAPIDVRHPLAGLLRERAAGGGTDPRPMLAIRPLFGELGEDERLIAPVARWLEVLYAQGAAATLDAADL